MRLIAVILCLSMPLLGFAAQEGCTAIRGAASCSMLQHSVSEKLDVKTLDATAGKVFKQLEGVSLSPSCINVFRATMCTILMPSCNATEFAVGDYRHQKPCKFLELYLNKICGLKLPVADLTFGEAPDCFVPSVVEQPACISQSKPTPSASQSKSKGPLKVPKNKAPKAPKVDFSHLVQDWEVAASLVEGDTDTKKVQSKSLEADDSEEDSKASHVPKSSAESSKCLNVGSSQTEALLKVADALDSYGAAEHAHFVYLQALQASSISQQPVSIDVVRRIFSLMHAAVEGAAISQALVDVHVHSADSSLRQCLSAHSALVADVAASSFISEEAKIKELRKMQQRFDLDTFVETGTYFGVTLGGLLGNFDRLISVEISQSLHDANVKRFQEHQHVTLLQGDSRAMLPRMIKELPVNAKSLFWLDGHFSGSKFETSRVDIDSPVISELHTVLSQANMENSVIAIDDARMFLGNNNCSGVFRSECYPHISQIAHVVCVHKPHWSIQISGDMIKISPPRKIGSKSSEGNKKVGGDMSESDGHSPHASRDMSSSESASANSFSVKAPSKKKSPRPQTSAAKSSKPSATIPPPKQKVAPKVKISPDIPENVESESKSNKPPTVQPPTKKKHGQPKAKVSSAAPELSVEDAYDYEL